MMERTPWIAGTLATSLALAATAGTVASQPRQDPPAAEAGADEDGLVLYSGGLDDIFVAPMDEPLREALRLLDERLGELPGELDQQGAPVGLIRLFAELAQNPVLVRLNPATEPGGEVPVAVQVSVSAPDEAAAERYAQQLQGFFSMFAEDTRPGPVEGVQTVDVNGMPVNVGLLDVEGVPTVVVGLNTLEAERPDLGWGLLPEDVSPAFAFRFDPAALRPLIEMALENAGPDAEMVREQFAWMGFAGETPLVITAAMGHTEDRTVGRARLRNYAVLPAFEPYVVREPLTNDILRMIPADATAGEVSRADLSAVFAGLRQFAERSGDPTAPEQLERVFGQVEEHLGVHPERDVVAHLGDVTGWYMSDTTGGGGLASVVFFVEAENPDALGNAIDRLVSRVNEVGRADAKGYVRIDRREMGGHVVYTLTFPGLPLPLQPAFALAEGYLYGGATVPAVVAAIEQATGDAPGLPTSPNFRRLVEGNDLDEAVALSFVDNARMGRVGYGLTTAGLTMLSNALRSPADPERDPGLLMPRYTDLLQNAIGQLTITRYDGDDLVIEYEGDRSALVNIAGSAGAIGPVVVGLGGVGALTGVMAPALGKARENASQVRSMSQLRQIAMAAQMYADQHDGSLPASLDVLVEANFLTEPILDSPLGDAGNGDYWFAASGVNLEEIERPDRRIIAYDRAAWENADEVIVLFADGHVEAMSHDRFLNLTDEDANRGVDFGL